MGAEFSTHFEIALKTIFRENLLKNFAILSETCVAGAPTRAPIRAPGPSNPKSHYKSPG
jgi:hypothetical protein